jgi:dihydrofolate reductase
MRKIIEYCIVSADGTFDDPDPVQAGVRGYQDDAYVRDSLGLFHACDAMLFGRATYELFARSYGLGGGNPAYAARFNAMRKYVFSSKLEHAEWNNSTIVRGDVVEEVTRLKQQPGASLVVLGHGRLSETLLQHRLIDVLELSIYPELLGRGRPFLRDGQAVKLKLTATKSFANNVKLIYEPRP